jgi:hypothetical protein
MRIQVFILILFIYSFSFGNTLLKSRGFFSNKCYQERGSVKCTANCIKCQLDLYPESIAKISFNVQNIDDVCEDKNSINTNAVVYFKVNQDHSGVKIFRISNLTKKPNEIIRMSESMNVKEQPCLSE